MHVEGAARRLAEASRALLDGTSGDMPARMLRSLQAREAAAREELRAVQAAAAARTDEAHVAKEQAQAEEPFAVTTPAAAVEVRPLKKEAFKGAISLGVCENDLCLCADCE